MGGVTNLIHASHNNRLIHSLHESGQQKEEMAILLRAVEEMKMQMKHLRRRSRSFSQSKHAVTDRRKISTLHIDVNVLSRKYIVKTINQQQIYVQYP